MTEEKEHWKAKEARLAREAKERGENNEVATETVTAEPKTEKLLSLSEVEQMMANMKRELLASMPNNNPQPQQVQQVSNKENDIDDIPELRGFEMKYREYILCDDMRPISYSIAKEHTRYRPLQYTNKETKKVHAMRYASNQPSFFIENQSTTEGSVLVTDIVFLDGKLKVYEDNILLQKFLAIHPDMNKVFKEYDPKENSVKFINDKKLMIKANNLAMSIGNISNRSIACLVCPSYIESWDDELILEEILLYIEKEPKKYIELANDPKLKMKGIAKYSIATGDLIYRNYKFYNKNNDFLIEVPKNNDEIEEIVKYFETSDGRSTYEYLLNTVPVD